MKLLRCLVAPSLLCAVLWSAGCEPSEPKKTAAKVPAQASAPTITQAPAVTATPQSAVQAGSVTSDPVDALIAQGNKLHQDGTTHYQAGHLEAPGKSFDQAFNVLRSRKIEVRDSPRLEREFD